MTDFQSHPEIDDELLSAYLDDELSPDERARVDARLADDPEARRMLDQLRAASQAMQNLPRESVGQDLRESILRRAEAAMLTSSAGRSAATAKPVATNGTIGLRDSLPRITIGQTRRGWVWAALAVAAGLLIMVFQPGGQQGNNLPPVAASRSEERLDQAGAADRAADPELRKGYASKPLAAATGAADSDSFVEAEAAPAAGAPMASGAATRSPKSVALDLAAPAAPATSTSTLNDDAGIMANDGTVAARTPALNGGFGVAPAQSGRAGGALADAPAIRQFGDEAKDTNGRLPAAATNEPAPASAAASGRRMAEVPPQGSVGGETSLGAVADALAKAPAQATAEDFVVVHVVATPEALRNKAFDQLLTKNGIQFEEPREEETESESAAESLVQEDSADRKLGRASGAPQDESGGRPDEDMVLVAAPRSTIELCLSELKQDQANYLGVSVGNTTDTMMAARDKSVSIAGEPAKKLATELGTRFNRGTVPPQNLEPTRLDYFFYESSKGQDQEGASTRVFGGGLGGQGDGRGALKQEQEQLRASVESLGLSTSELSGRGRARRVRSWGFDDQKKRDLLLRGGTVAEDRSSITASRQLGEVEQKVKAPAEAASENVYVLFFLSPDTRPPAAAAPSPATENRPE